MTKPAEEFALREVYSAEFRVHAIMLIWLGYRRLVLRSFANAEEDEITGELMAQMESVSEDPDSPDWVEQCEVHEQVRQNVEGKSGKRRPIIDVEIRRHQRGPRMHIGFEAKRLGPNHPIGGYLGAEGLAAFITGYYPNTHGEAGMLGYVQEKTCEDWSGKLIRELSDGSAKHQVAPDGQLKPLDIDATMPSFRSVHIDAQGKPLLVLHVLLAFTASD